MPDPTPVKLVVDQFSKLDGGMDSGIAVIDLPPNKFSYGTNTTVRGGHITHRPPFRDINPIYDSGVSLSGLLFQGACFYDPDFGSESIVALIGGRLFQFVPDSSGNAYVYDRTIRDYASGSGFVSSSTKTTVSYSLVLTNLTDASGGTYASGTSLTTDPSFLTVSAQPLTMPPMLVNNDTQVQWNGTLVLNPTFIDAAALVGKMVYIGADGVSGQVKWSVTGSGTSGSSETITIQYTAPKGVSGGTITIPGGSPIYTTTNPSPPQTLGTTNAAFTAPAINSTVTVSISKSYPGSVGDNLMFGGGIYQVSQIPIPTNTNSVVTTEQASTTNSSQQFTYDTNPAGIREAWLWQSENYVIVNNKVSRPIFFDGISSRRSLTATYVGTAAEAFSIPQIGQPVAITLNSDFGDAVGTFINISPIGLFPFLMQVVAVDGSVITAVNVTGQSSVNAIVPITTPINSTSSPSYSGVLTNNFTAITAPGTSVTLLMSPPFSGEVGDILILTDGTGPLTEYEFTVTAINGGGASVTATSDNAPTGLIIGIGYPIISQNTIANELPPGGMGAYVQGRNWISLPSGQQFIASDQVGDSSGSVALNYRDAVLKWSINTTRFSVPGDAGQIAFIVPLSSLDASLGQGPLQIGCDNDIFTCSAPDNATQWATTTTPILSESAISVGGVGQNAATTINSDLIFKDRGGGIYSLKLVRQDFEEWDGLPISQEMNRVIQQENKDLYSYLTFMEVNNRCLSSCSPIEEAGVIYSQGMIARDDDVTSSLQGKHPPVYDGVWKGLDLLQFVSGRFGGLERTFAFVQDGTSVALVELMDSGPFDNGNQKICWSFETGPLLKCSPETPNIFNRLETGEIYISRLKGSATIKVWYRPDYDECWHPWTQFSVCADNITVCAARQYRVRLGLGKPSSDDCDPTVNKKPTDGRYFQLRFEIEGSLTLMQCSVGASVQQQPLFAPIPVNEGQL